MPISFARRTWVIPQGLSQVPQRHFLGDQLWRVRLGILAPSLLHLINANVFP